MNDAVAEKHDFGAEVGRLLDLVVHSLYSEREIFLRELVANAADAMDRRRFEALTDAALAPPAEAKVRIVPDKAARTLLIADDGIGMGRQELIDNLGTIARSGTRAFGAALASAKPEERPSLIGQFGVGFYSAFMVADRVEVTSRKAGSEEAFTWASDGGGRVHHRAGDARDRGHRRRAAHEGGCRGISSIRSGSRRSCANGPTTSRCRSPSRATARTCRRTRAPRCGASRGPRSRSSRTTNSTAISAICSTRPGPRCTGAPRACWNSSRCCSCPGMKPFEPFDGDRESHVKLHVRRMFITDKAELLPPWLRFVQGVVDTEDLPLNVSREMLQTTPVLGRIRKALIGRVLSELKNRAKDAEDYAQVLGQFRRRAEGGRLGGRRAPRRDRAAAAVPFVLAGRLDLAAGLPRRGCRRGRTRSGTWPATTCEALRASPQLEGFRAKGTEVLLLSDPIDAFWPERLDSFEGKHLKSVTQASGELGEGCRTCPTSRRCWLR